MLTLREIRRVENHDAILGDESKRKEVSDWLDRGDIVVARQVVPKDRLLAIRAYLTRVGQNTLPAYSPIVQGAPNFHRINDWDERSYVKGCFHQFSFLPWNQDYFRAFELLRPVYAMRNLLAGLCPDAFLAREPYQGCVARLSFQFYPSGQGALNRHVDPYDFHQRVVPIILMSKKGVDFHEGGAYVETSSGERVILDDGADIGDVIYFNSQMAHGVAPIDPGSGAHWLDFRGRWIMLAAVNRLAGNTAVGDAKDLEA